MAIYTGKLYLILKLKMIFPFQNISFYIGSVILYIFDRKIVNIF